MVLFYSGGMVFTFLRAQGLQTGSSLVEVDKLGLAMDLVQQAEAHGVQLLLPSDVVIADRFAYDAESRNVPVDAIPEGWMVRLCMHKISAVRLPPCLTALIVWVCSHG